jgi:hypothetical protein
VNNAKRRSPDGQKVIFLRRRRIQLVLLRLQCAELHHMALPGGRSDQQTTRLQSMALWSN